MFDAANAELAEVGYRGTSLPRIAERSGVALSTIYRRWGSLDGLVRELVDQSLETIPSTPSGDLERDLTTVAHALLRLAQDPVHRAWMSAMVSAAVHDADTRTTLSAVIEGRVDRAAAVLANAVAALDTPTPVDAHECARLLAAPFYYRTYISGEALAEDLVEQTVARVAAAVRAGAVGIPPT